MKHPGLHSCFREGELSVSLLSVPNVGRFIINHIPPNRLRHHGMLTEPSLCFWRKVNTGCFASNSRACMVQDLFHLPHPTSSDRTYQKAAHMNKETGVPETGQCQLPFAEDVQGWRALGRLCDPEMAGDHRGA